MTQKNILGKDLEEKINLFEAETTTEAKLIIELRNLRYDLKTIRDEQRKQQEILNLILEILQKPVVTKEVIE